MFDVNDENIIRISWECYPFLWKQMVYVFVLWDYDSKLNFM